MHSESYTADMTAPWRLMTPVKRYRFHTLFAKKTTKGEVVFESFLNTEIDRWKNKGGVTNA